MDRAVTDATTYTFSVVATNALGSGPPSEPVSATPGSTQVVPPGPPTGLVAQAGAGQISLSWAPPSATGGAPITGYRVYRGTTSTALVPLASAGTTSLVDSSAAVGTTYYYAVTAVTSAGEGTSSDQASASAYAGPPTAPTLSGVAGPGRVDLSWTAPTSDGGAPVTKYVVVRDGVRWLTVSGDTYAATDSPLAAGTQHVYQLRAVNAVGGSPYSSAVTIAAQ